uniref:Uncharacterized protein LOC100367132 n=1 Tax=Saccoglossus kowalevskii TaxID=10224 RepID=A0ABM0GUS6_SACKO|nr:PREDICTED: uncharacterized protein LOC100367132 [Saccoglossus kowalevskii]
MEDATVTCRELGYLGAMLDEATRKSWDDYTSMGFYISNVGCEGTESNLMDCERSIIPSGDCRSPYREASVTCNIPGYLGCYFDNTDNQSSSSDNTRKYISQDMTVARCTTFCRDEGFPYGSLVRGLECRCRDNITELYQWKRANKLCDFTCGGSSYICGGYQHLSVYETKYGSCGENPITLQATTSGTLVSPGFPGDYPAGSDCQWILKVGAKKTINMTFIMFEMHFDQNDWVELRDGPAESSPLLGSFTGVDYGSGTLPDTITSTSSEVLVTFKSDRADEDRGFVLEYIEIGTEGDENVPEDNKGFLKGFVVGAVFLGITLIVVAIIFIGTFRSMNKNKKRRLRESIAEEPPADVDITYRVVEQRSRARPSSNDDTLTQIPSYNSPDEVDQRPLESQQMLSIHASDAPQNSDSFPVEVNKERSAIEKPRNVEETKPINRTSVHDESPPDSSSSESSSDGEGIVDNAIYDKAGTQV